MKLDTMRAKLQATQPLGKALEACRVPRAVGWKVGLGRT